MKSSPVSFSEVPFWRALKADWRQLYGGYEQTGVSMEWHDFELEREAEWSRSFHPGSLELCVNLGGRAAFSARTEQPPSKVVYLYAPGAGFHATRLPGPKHIFLTIEMSAAWLRANLAEGWENVRPELLEFLAGPPRSGSLLSFAPLRDETSTAARSVELPRISGPGTYLWLRARLFEILALELFEPGEQELFCTRHQRVSRDRIRRVQNLLAADLENPPTLDQLASSVGCSPFYLSRLFSRETGMTLSRYLRHLRLERAAELLRTGRYNVTEAAMEVGYSSLSHFSKAFTAQHGRCPCAYPFSRATSPADG